MNNITSILVVLLVLYLLYNIGNKERYENGERYRYHNYWSDEVALPTKKYFEMLLDPLEIEKKVFLHSVFNQIPYEGDYKGENELHILYSGESWYNDIEKYDIKLIMEETDMSKGIINHPLFIMDSYVYNYWPIYMNVREPKVKRKFCAFVVSNGTNVIRNRFFEKLSMYKKVDSMGGALNNTGVYAPRNDEMKGDYSFYEFLSEYKFMICFENGSSANYLTEKLANAYLGNTIPIYWGASKVRDWLNTKSFLQLEESATEGEMDKLIGKIIELDNNDDLYEEVYREPLMYSIHDELNINKIREKISEVVRSKK
jgi:hypothetical protein